MIKIHINNKGFTLIEMMIGITISSILMLGVSQIFSSGKRTYKLNNELARTQENIRYAVEEMARDVRMAGYTGCRNNTLTSTLNPGTNWVDNIGTSLLGYEGGVDTFPTEYASNVIAGTDSLIVLRGGADTGITFDQKQNASNFTVSTVNHGLYADDIIMLSDCTHTAILQVTNSSPGTNTTIVHNTGGSPPGNCTKGLGSIDCSSTNGLTYPWNKDAHVVKFLATAYYIADSVNGLPGSRSLYRMSLDTNPDIIEELVEGVENMQITYGYDSNGDGFANRYIKANEVNAASDFKDVVSIRLGLLFQSQINATRAVNKKDYTLAGTTISSAVSPGSLEYTEDTRLRFQLNTVIKLRNLGVK